MEDKIYFAVGKYLGDENVEIESLEYFDTMNKAENFYFSKLQQIGFKAVHFPVLAIFIIKNNTIVHVDYLYHHSEDMKFEPVGHIDVKLSIK